MKYIQGLDVDFQCGFFWHLLQENKITLTGNLLSGKTYEVKEYIKAEFGARWNSDGKAWQLDATGLEKFNQLN